MTASLAYIAAVPIVEATQAEHHVSSVREASLRYSDIRDAFDRIKRKYSGFLSQWRKTIDQEDLESIKSCLENLISLEHDSVVREESQSTKVYETTLFYHMSHLQADMVGYLSRFKHIRAREPKAETFKKE